MSAPEIQPELASAGLEDDLSEVHSFYLYLLESTFGEEIPVSGQIAHETDALRRFVMLLDLAVTPQMIRSGFQPQEHRKAAGALLRFYAKKPHRRREDRDKVDVVATILFRANFPEFSGNGSLHLDPAVRGFADMLERIYADIELPPPAPEYLQLVRRFEILRNEASTLRNFNELIDSGIIQRVHAIKQTLGPSIMHPRVLCILAGYNAYFHKIFDGLFAKATEEMRAFAAQADRDNAITMPVDDRDERSPIGGDALRQISQVRETIENDRRQHRSVPDLLSAIKNFSEPEVSAASHTALDLEEISRSKLDGYTTPSSTLSTAEAERQELEATKAAIRSFLRISDIHGAQVVPLPDGTIHLSSAETEAFLADYGTEKTFRSVYCALLVEMATIGAHLGIRLTKLEQTRHTPYDWKPHADALTHLLSEGKDAASSAMDLAAGARERGMDDKADTLMESIEKIRPRGRAAVEALQLIGAVDAERTS